MGITGFWLQTAFVFIGLAQQSRCRYGPSRGQQSIPGTTGDSKGSAPRAMGKGTPMKPPWEEEQTH